MNLLNYRHPIRFYILSTLIPWFFWFFAAYLSHKSLETKTWEGVFGLLGLISPVLVAYFMMPSKEFFKRIFNFKGISFKYFIITCFLMLGSILSAQLISLLFGKSIQQFQLAEGTTFTYSLFPAWFLLFLAPLLEELAWHSYGTDCLRARFNLFTSSMIFAVIWFFWHFPLGFIKDYYHNNVAESGLLYSLNFLVSLFPFVLLMNWLYYKTDRNIGIAIIFHITAGVFNELFQTHPDSKVIQTVLLIILTTYLIVKDRDFFFDRKME